VIPLKFELGTTELALIVGTIGVGFILWYIIESDAAQIYFTPETWHWPEYVPTGAEAEEIPTVVVD
jgi:hypothetical protein